MPQPTDQPDPIVQQLEEIKGLLQTLLIIQGARAGLTRDQVRELAGVATQRVSDIWGYLKSPEDRGPSES